jgi:hypothetical protein
MSSLVSSVQVFFEVRHVSDLITREAQLLKQCRECEEKAKPNGLELFYDFPTPPAMRKVNMQTLKDKVAIAID